MALSYAHTKSVYKFHTLKASHLLPPLSLFLSSFLLASLPFPFSLVQVETLSKQTANNGSKPCTFEGGLSARNISVIDL